MYIFFSFSSNKKLSIKGIGQNTNRVGVHKHVIFFGLGIPLIPPLPPPKKKERKKKM